MDILSTIPTASAHKRRRLTNVSERSVLTGNASRLFYFLLVLYRTRHRLYSRHIPNLYQKILWFASSFQKAKIPDHGCLVKIRHNYELFCRKMNVRMQLTHGLPYLVLSNQLRNFVLKPNSSHWVTFPGSRFQGFWLSSKDNRVISVLFPPFVPHLKNIRVCYYDIRPATCFYYYEEHVDTLESRKITFPFPAAFRCAVWNRQFAWTQLDPEHGRLEIAVCVLSKPERTGNGCYHVFSTQITKNDTPLLYAHLKTKEAVHQNKKGIRLCFHNNGKYLLLVFFTSLYVWKMDFGNDGIVLKKNRLLMHYTSSKVWMQASFHPTLPILYMAEKSHRLVLRRVRLSNLERLDISMRDVMRLKGAYPSGGIDKMPARFQMAVSPSLVMISSCFAPNDLFVLDPSRGTVVRHYDNLLKYTNKTRHQVLCTVPHWEEDIFLAQCTDFSKHNNFLNSFFIFKL